MCDYWATGGGGVLVQAEAAILSGDVARSGRACFLTHL